MFIVRDNNNIRYVGPGPVTALDSGQVMAGDMVLSRRIMTYAPEMEKTDEDHGPLVILQGEEVKDNETRQLVEKYTKEVAVAVAVAASKSERPQIVIVSTTTLPDGGEAMPLDLVKNDDREATCQEGASVTLTAEMRDGQATILPVNETYRLPVRARDGREFVARATFVDGTANIVIPFAASGVWEITETAINSILPASAHVSFAGFTVYVMA